MLDLNPYMGEQLQQTTLMIYSSGDSGTKNRKRIEKNSYVTIIITKNAIFLGNHFGNQPFKFKPTKAKIAIQKQQTNKL